MRRDEPDATEEQATPRDPAARVLTVRGLRVAFGKAQVLDGVDLHVDRGERVGVVGPNGAGKTTLLRALSLVGVLCLAAAALAPAAR